jgi:hypothetical protein
VAHGVDRGFRRGHEARYIKTTNNPPQKPIVVILVRPASEISRLPIRVIYTINYLGNVVVLAKRFELCVKLVYALLVRFVRLAFYLVRELAVFH